MRPASLRGSTNCWGPDLMGMHTDTMTSRPAGSRATPYEVIADYDRRSLSHVVGLPEQMEAPGLWRGVGYRIGAHRLASGFDEVVEILTLPPVTPVPGEIGRAHV